MSWVTWCKKQEHQIFKNGGHPSHTLALGQSGTVYVWGSNKEGQLGKMDKISSNRLISCQTANCEEKLISKLNASKKMWQMIGWHLIHRYMTQSHLTKKTLLTTLYHELLNLNYKFSWISIITNKNESFWGFLCFFRNSDGEFVKACRYVVDLI